MTGILAVVCAALWTYMLCARGGFWTCAVSDRTEPERLATWPSVAVVIPARNEATLIASSVKSLLQQDYPGPLSITVVDDDSDDETAATARATADATQPVPGSVARDMKVLKSHEPPVGWAGKVWAMYQGIAAAEMSSPEFLLLTDADVVHAPDTLSWLVAKSMSDNLVLTSLMPKLRCRSLAERSHAPAFVYFFQMLFPFRDVSRKNSTVAAAVGGCMLVRADALRDIGGIGSIRNALIDDCSLAAKLKLLGPIWLGLTDRAHSIRPCDRLADVRQMASRYAYAQLGYSPVMLAAALIAMMVIFVAPPALAIFSKGLAQYLGLAAWLAMAVSFQPILRMYRLSPLWGIALPAIAFLYALYTLDSAYQYFRRRGGLWKGRVHVNMSDQQ